MTSRDNSQASSIKATAWKVSRYRVFSGSYLDTFHAVSLQQISYIFYISYSLIRGKETLVLRKILRFHEMDDLMSEC